MNQKHITEKIIWSIKIGFDPFPPDIFAMIFLEFVWLMAINALRLLQELRFIVGVLSMASLTGAGAGTKTLSSCYSLKSHQ